MNELIEALLVGDLTPAQRVWTAAAPALVLLTWVLGGLAVFALRNALGHSFLDREVAARGSTVLLGAYVRQYFAWLMSPFIGAFMKARLPANAITTLSLLLASGAGVAIAAGRFALGGWLFVASGACDFLDGRVARLSEQAGPRGALLDSVLDRYVEAAILVGLAWYYRDSWVLLPVLGALVGSMLVPYVRARGEGLGARFDNVGLMQRPERVVILGASIALSPILEAILVPADPHPLHRVAVAGVIVVAGAAHVTSLQRLAHGLAALGTSAKDRALGAGRGSLARNLVAGGIATGADFSLVLVLVFASFASPAFATFLGAALGATVNFAINRFWTFQSRGRYTAEATRYAFVSATSAGLNAGGVAIFMLLPSFPYQVAWLVVRLAVFVTWNYPLHRDYVFARPALVAPLGLKEELPRA